MRKLVVLDKIKFLGLKEIQITYHLRIDVKGFWDSLDIDFEGVDSNGSSSALISIWDNKTFQKTDVIKNPSYMIIIGTWSGIPRGTILDNIYGPQAPSKKKNLLPELIQIKQA